MHSHAIKKAVAGNQYQPLVDEVTADHQALGFLRSATSTAHAEVQTVIVGSIDEKDITPAISMIGIVVSHQILLPVQMLMLASRILSTSPS